MTDEQLNEILAYCNAATPGPWESDEQNEFNDYCVWGPKHDGLCGEDGFIANVDNGENLAAAFDLSWQNAEFIARARADLPAVVRELLEARKERDVFQASTEDRLRQIGAIAEQLGAARGEILKLRSGCL